MSAIELSAFALEGIGYATRTGAANLIFPAQRLPRPVKDRRDWCLRSVRALVGGRSIIYPRSWPSWRRLAHRAP